MQIRKQSNAKAKKRTDHDKKFLYCAECEDFVPRKIGPRHVCEVHLRERLFECSSSACDFFSMFSLEDVQSHITEKHPELKGSAAQPTSYLDTFEIEIADWTRRCWSTKRGRTFDKTGYPEKPKPSSPKAKVQDTSGDRTKKTSQKIRPRSIRVAIKRKLCSVEGLSPVSTQSASKKPKKEIPSNYPHCLECEKNILTCDRKAHMYRYHVKKADMFKCPKCDTFSKSSKYNIKAHLAAIHGTTTDEVISRENVYTEEIEHWERCCWGQRRSVATTASKSPMRDAQAKNIAAQESQDDTIKSGLSEFSDKSEVYMADSLINDDTLNALYEEENEENMTAEPLFNESSTTSGNQQLTGSSRLICLLCSTTVSRQAQRLHVFKKHLKVDDLFGCAQCQPPFRSSYDQRHVRLHVKKLHDDDTTLIKSRVAEYQTEIALLEQQCFTREPSQRTSNDWVTCIECQNAVKVFERRIHVLREHIAIPDMFACLHCDFTCSYSRRNVVMHTQRVHNINDGKIISRETEYADNIGSKNLSCFPRKHDQFRSTWRLFWSKDGTKMPKAEFCSMCPKDVNNRCNASHIRTYHLPPLFASKVCGYQSHRMQFVLDHLGGHHPDQASSDFMVNLTAEYSNEFIKAERICYSARVAKEDVQPKTRKRIKCGLCQAEVCLDNKARHIFEYHLAVDDLFKCIICGFTSDFDASIIKEHVRVEHQSSVKDSFISRVPDFADKIASFTAFCFDPNARLNARLCAKKIFSQGSPVD